MIYSKPFSIKVIGAFDLADRGGQSVRPSGRKDCAVVAMLALTSNHRQTRTWLQDKLWGDRGPAQGAASLRQSLSTLRGILNRNEDVLRSDRTWVWLEPDKIDFDHLSGDVQGEILRGFDLRDEGFNDWLRETRAVFERSEVRWGAVDVPALPDRIWHLNPMECKPGDEELNKISDVVCDSLSEALSVIGVHAVIDHRANPVAPAPRATDIAVNTRAIRFGSALMLSLSATDGFGTLLWQFRREANATRWSELRAVQIECAQLFQDFAIRTEAESLRGARWSAHANGCQALMGMLVPGSIPLQELVQCSESAIAADEKGIYHALLGYSHLLRYGEREKLCLLDADQVMQSFRTALRISPSNGLVLALAGHGYGFVMRDLARNADLTKEAVRLLPGSGVCWAYHAISQVYCGRYEDAVLAARKAVRLCQGTMAQPMARVAEHFALLMSGDINGAIIAGEISIDEIMFRPTIMNLMTAYTLSGQVEKGRKTLRLLLEREPELCVDMLNSPEYPFVNSAHREVTIQSAEQLGLH